MRQSNTDHLLETGFRITGRKRLFVLSRARPYKSIDREYLRELYINYGPFFLMWPSYEAKFAGAEIKRKYLGLKVLNGNTFEDFCT
jgi:hypothetical protein